MEQIGEEVNFNYFISTYAEFHAELKNDLFFEVSGRRSKHLKIVKSVFCDQPPRCTGLHDKNSGESVASGLVTKLQRYYFVILEGLL